MRNLRRETGHRFHQDSPLAHNLWGPPVTINSSPSYAQVCSTLAGRPTTLKRSGSDYSATKILDASNVAGLKPDRAGNEALENGP